MRLMRLLFFLIPVLLGSSASSLAATSSLPAEAVTKLIWGKLLTQCGTSYVYIGSPFDRSGLASTAQIGHQDPIEYRGVRFRTTPMRVTDAEQANGIAYRGRISMIAHLYREKGQQWQDGPDLQPRNTDDLIGRALSNANGDMFDMGGGGAIALELVRSNGKWYVARSSTTLSGPLIGSKYLDVDALLAAPSATYNCKTGDVAAAPPSPAELEAQKRARDKNDADMRSFKEEMARNEAAKKAALASWSYAGPPAGFREALVINLRKRALEFNLDANIYASEVNRILQIVQTCTAVTRNEWNTAWHTTTDRRKQEQILHGCDGQWQNSGLFGTSVSQGNRPRVIQVDSHVSEKDDTTNKYAMPPYFTINVYFDRLNSDPFVDKTHLFDNYIIVSAKIPFVNYLSDDQIDKAERTVVRNTSHGVPFTPISAFEFQTFASYYDSAGQSRYIDKRLPDGSTVPIEYDTLQQWIGRFNNGGGTNPWLAPGTTYTAPCRAMSRMTCKEFYSSGKLINSSHQYIIIQMTSGPQSGQYALIDQANYVPGAGAICAGGQC